MKNWIFFMSVTFLLAVFLRVQEKTHHVPVLRVTMETAPSVKVLFKRKYIYFTSIRKNVNMTHKY